MKRTRGHKFYISGHFFLHNIHIHVSNFIALHTLHFAILRCTQWINVVLKSLISCQSQFTCWRQNIFDEILVISHWAILLHISTSLHHNKFKLMTFRVLCIGIIPFILILSIHFTKLSERVCIHWNTTSKNIRQNGTQQFTFYYNFKRAFMTKN